MKKLFFLLTSMLVSASVFSQPQSSLRLRIANNTPCYQYFVVFGNEYCKCGDSYVSNIISIAPYSVLYFYDSTTLGGSYPSSVPKGVVGAKILNGSPACNPNGGSVGMQACSHPYSYAFTSISTSCSPCANTKATWTPETNCDEGATLLFE